MEPIKTYKYSKDFIRVIANKIMDALTLHNMAGDACIYVNGLRFCGDFDGSWENDNSESYFHGQDYCECAGNKQIISFSTEGPLYNYIYNNGYPSWLANIVEKADLYIECCTSWFFVIVPNGDWDEWEVYENPTQRKETHYIYCEAQCPDNKILAIRRLWESYILVEPDSGSCVIGAGIEFEYNDMKYFMSVPTMAQGCLTWEKSVDHIKSCLVYAGATNVWYNPGRMD